MGSTLTTKFNIISHCGHYSDVKENMTKMQPTAFIHLNKYSLWVTLTQNKNCNISFSSIVHMGILRGVELEGALEII